MPIIINGKTVQPNDLEQIEISKSERTIESFIPPIKAADRASSVAFIGGPSYTYQAIGRATDVTDDFIEGAVGYKNVLSGTKSYTLKSEEGEPNRVFIVHGHNENAQNKAARFVEKLGFEAIILHEKLALEERSLKKSSIIQMLDSQLSCTPQMM